MSSSISTRKLIGMPGDPESLASSLAHVVASREGEDVILGQAWLAAPGKLITCGHVVEEFKRNPAGVTVKFPLSGSRYVVREIKLHPTYGKKGNEQLTKFDLAVLSVDLMAPDSNAPLLPITFDKYDFIPAQQSLSAIRYPSHLGQLTTSQFPLAQVGRYLGHLKKSDRFHLLHDLALAPGDSGSPIFDGDSVIAVHCGDTATLPGLNLPTTSIRLAVSIDALRALEIHETRSQKDPGMFLALGPGLLSFLVTTIVSFAIVVVLMIGPIKAEWSLMKSSLGTVRVTFNEPIKEYKDNAEVSITFTPEVDCYLNVFYTEDDQALILFPPPQTGLPSMVEAGKDKVIDGYGNYRLKANTKKGGKIHLFVLKNEQTVVSKEELEKVDPDYCRLPISATELITRLNKIESSDTNNVINEVFDAPQAKLPGGSSFEKETSFPVDDQAGQSVDDNQGTQSKEDSIDTSMDDKANGTSIESGDINESSPGKPAEDNKIQSNMLNEASGRHNKVLDALKDGKQKESTESESGAKPIETDTGGWQDIPPQ